MKSAKHIICLLLCTAFLAGCENDIQEVIALGKKNAGVEEGFNIESYMSTAGKVKAKLIAPYMLRNNIDSAKTEFPKTLNVTFYDTTIKPESFLFAKYGVYFMFNNTVLLKDSIVVYSIKHDTLWCHDLLWNQNSGTFFTDKPIVISQDNEGIRQKIYGRGLLSDQAFKNVTIYKPGILYNNNKNSFIIIKDSSANAY